LLPALNGDSQDFSGAGVAALYVKRVQSAYEEGRIPVDFDYTPQEEVFRQELRAWLLANPPQGYDPITFLHLDQDARFAIQLNWQKQLYRAGWVGIHWPKAYGGRGATVMEQTIYRQETVRARMPEVANFMGMHRAFLPGFLPHFEHPHAVIFQQHLGATRRYLRHVLGHCRLQGNDQCQAG
jgi:alkylation response protein AidB-like acyl-CoA dehydrogenase